MDLINQIEEYMNDIPCIYMNEEFYEEKYNISFMKDNDNIKIILYPEMNYIATYLYVNDEQIIRDDLVTLDDFKEMTKSYFA